MKNQPLEGPMKAKQHLLEYLDQFEVALNSGDKVAISRLCNSQRRSNTVIALIGRVLTKDEGDDLKNPPDNMTYQYLASASQIAWSLQQMCESFRVSLRFGSIPMSIESVRLIKRAVSNYSSPQ